MQQVGIVILVYNSFEDAAHIISSLRQRKYGDIELAFIIVDNASPDQSYQKELLASLAPSDHFLPQAENRGYASGNNVGLKFAHQKGIQSAFLVNPDIRISDPQIFHQTMQAMEQAGGALMVAPAVSGSAPYIARPSFRHYLLPFLYKLDNTRLFKQKQAEATITVYRLYGCFLLIDLEKFKQIGWFDTHTFLFGEEEIVAEKAIAKGMQMKLIPHLTIEHVGSVSINAAFGLKKNKLKAQSHFYYLHTYRQIPYLLAALLAFHFGIYNYLMDIKNALIKTDFIKTSS